MATKPKASAAAAPEAPQEALPPAAPPKAEDDVQAKARSVLTVSPPGERAYFTLNNQRFVCWRDHLDAVFVENRGQGSTEGAD